MKKDGVQNQNLACLEGREEDLTFPIQVGNHDARFFFISRFPNFPTDIWLKWLNFVFQLPTEVAETIQEINQPLALEQLAHGLLYLGGFVFLVSMVGYCGASKESRFLLVLVSKSFSIIQELFCFIKWGGSVSEDWITSAGQCGTNEKKLGCSKI